MLGRLLALQEIGEWNGATAPLIVREHAARSRDESQGPELTGEASAAETRSDRTEGLVAERVARLDRFTEDRTRSSDQEPVQIQNRRAICSRMTAYGHSGIALAEQSANRPDAITEAHRSERMRLLLRMRRAWMGPHKDAATTLFLCALLMPSSGSGATPARNVRSAIGAALGEIGEHHTVGHDVFAVLLPNQPSRHVGVMARTIRATIEARGARYGLPTVRFVFSLTSIRPYEDPVRTLALADRTLAAAASAARACPPDQKSRLRQRSVPPHR